MATLTTMPALSNYDRIQASYTSFRNLRALLGAHEAVTPQVLSLQLVEIIRHIVRHPSFIFNPRIDTETLY